MDLYYNLTRQCRVDAGNCVISGRPVLYLGSKPELILHFFTGEPGSDPSAADLSGIVAWRAAVDADWNAGTDPMCRTLSEEIDAASAAAGVIKLPLNTCTVRFAEALGTRQSLEACLELRGFDASGAAAAVVLLNVICHNAVDVDGGAALDDVPDDVAEKSWVLAKLSNVAAAAAVTAFEVYAHDAIPSGQNEVLGGVVTSPVAANMTDSFYIRSDFAPADIDVAVDWGDGTVTELSALTPTTPSGYSDKWYLVSHEYSTVGVYTVRIVGSGYHAICRNSSTSNLLLRPFGADLPLAPHLTNFSSFCRACPLLINVDVSGGNFVNQAVNVATMFADNGINLKTVTGWQNAVNVRVCPQLFMSCYRMTGTDFRIPALLRDAAAAKQVFYGNYQLVANITDLLPVGGFVTGKVDVSGMFQMCNKVTSSGDPGKYLWNDPNVEWILPTQATLLPFIGTGPLHTAAPVSWGGESPDSIIKPELTGLDILHPVAVTGGAVVLDAAHNAYTIKPTEVTTVSIDASGLGEVVGASFFILLDFSEGAQTVTFPAAWTWVGGTAPTMTAKGVHVIRVTYASHGQTAFLAEYVGVAKNVQDLTRGIWYWNEEGELDTSVYEGQEYVASAEIVGGTLLVNADATAGTVSVANAPVGVATDFPGASSYVVTGGTVSMLKVEADYYYGAAYDFECRATVTSGEIGRLELSDDWSKASAEISGGTVGTAFVFSQRSGLTLTVSGGAVGTIDVSYATSSPDAGPILVTDGFVDTINITSATSFFDAPPILVTGGTVRRINTESNGGWIAVNGGTVGEIVSNSAGCSGQFNPVISGGVVGRIYNSGEGYNSFPITVTGGLVRLIELQNVDGFITYNDWRFYTVVISGGTVARLDYDDQSGGAVTVTGASKLWVSGGTVGITPRTRTLLNAGIIGGTFGPNAVIVDLDN